MSKVTQTLAQRRQRIDRAAKVRRTEAEEIAVLRGENELLRRECAKWKLASFDRGLLPLRDQCHADLARLILCEHILGQTEPESYGLGKTKGRATRSFLLQHIRSSMREIRAAIDALDAELFR